jgi:hypothetical protein
MTGQLGQDILDRTAWPGQPGQNSQKRTTRKEQRGQDPNAGLPGQECQDMTAERRWVLEPGFRCYAAKEGKSANSHFFSFAIASARTRKNGGATSGEKKEWRDPLKKATGRFQRKYQQKQFLEEAEIKLKIEDVILAVQQW